ncbi:hypothetical protein AK812_SmicGene33900 [Symbiodinium microadriaticum]|uniref:Uncharacterized protein n=1 Tax=Symbiodinium microadriaticum TaxID=2951 RepID=A0A1Q9CQE1_SYMMI|nr:hypothetical protein AK812_SmicGene33900 [Symbiodinium microadriaticum]
MERDGNRLLIDPVSILVLAFSCLLRHGALPHISQPDAEAKAFGRHVAGFGLSEPWAARRISAVSAPLRGGSPGSGGGDLVQRGSPRHEAVDRSRGMNTLKPATASAMALTAPFPMKAAPCFGAPGLGPGGPGPWRSWAGPPPASSRRREIQGSSALAACFCAGCVEGRRQQRQRVPLSAQPPEAQTLRFGVGDRVECNIDGFQTGTVVKLNYHDPGWPEERTVPYQVRLDSGVTIFATKDCDECIRKAEGSVRGSS